MCSWRGRGMEEEGAGGGDAFDCLMYPLPMQGGGGVWN